MVAVYRSSVGVRRLASESVPSAQEDVGGDGEIARVNYCRIQMPATTLSHCCCKNGQAGQGEKSRRPGSPFQVTVVEGKAAERKSCGARARSDWLTRRADRAMHHFSERLRRIRLNASSTSLAARGWRIRGSK